MAVIRKTKSVKKVLDIFSGSSDAISVVELVERLDSEMNKTTVYRVLERLEQDGTVHSFLGSDGLKWYAGCTGCSAHHHSDIHPHFECASCGKVECLDVEISIPRLPDRKINTAELLLRGTCDQCVN